MLVILGLPILFPKSDPPKWTWLYVEKNMNPGLMGLALKSLICWGKADLALEHIDLVVLPHNEHGIAFYQRCGFEKDGIVPLIKVETDDEISWIRCRDPVAEPEYYFLHMSLHE